MKIIINAKEVNEIKKGFHDVCMEMNEDYEKFSEEVQKEIKKLSEQKALTCHFNIAGDFEFEISEDMSAELITEVFNFVMELMLQVKQFVKTAERYSRTTKSIVDKYNK